MHEPRFCLRACGAGDAKLLLACYDGANFLHAPERRAPGSLETFEQMLREDHALLAEEGNTPLGLVSYRAKGKNLLITGLYVTNERQRSGAGGALLRAALEAGMAAGAAFCVLKALKSAPWARAFYEKHGFAVCDPALDDVAQRAMDAFSLTQSAHADTMCKKMNLPVAK